MPIYEYVADDGTRLEVMRSMKDADAPLADPEGKGRTFRRTLSVVASGPNKGGTSGSAGSSGHVHSGSCGCGKPRGSCSM
jgi:hypothetical protein